MANISRLRDNCKKMLDQLKQDAILRQGSPVDDLMAFVMAEKGKDADVSLENTLPLILYFGTNKSRNEFINLLREIKPGMYTKKLP